MDDIKLRQALSNLSDASHLENSEEVEERARVRKARAGVTERARQTGDSVGNLLTGLMGESSAALEAEKAEKARKTQEAEERARAMREAEEARKREAAELKLQEEKRRLEEKEQRRLQMLAEMERKRRLDAGEVDEEEEERLRREAEAKAAREAAEKAREIAEEARLKSSNQELADQIRLIKEQKAAEERMAAARAQKKSLIIRSVAAVAAIVIISALTFYFVNKKAPDFYTLNDDYETKQLSMTNDIPKAQTVEVAFLEVRQAAPKVAGTRTRSGGGPKKPEDKYGIGQTVDLSGGKIVH